MSRRTRDFGPEYSFQTDSQDVQSVLEFVGVPTEYHNDITAAMVLVGDGDYDEVWFSESAAPWELGALWDSIEYYREG